MISYLKIHEIKFCDHTAMVSRMGEYSTYSSALFGVCSDIGIEFYER